MSDQQRDQNRQFSAENHVLYQAYLRGYISGVLKDKSVAEQISYALIRQTTDDDVTKALLAFTLGADDGTRNHETDPYTPDMLVEEIEHILNPPLKVVK